MTTLETPVYSEVQDSVRARELVIEAIRATGTQHVMLSIPDPGFLMEREIADDPGLFDNVTGYPWVPLDQRTITNAYKMLGTSIGRPELFQVQRDFEKFLSLPASVIWLNWQTTWTQPKEAIVNMLVDSFRPIRDDTLLFITCGFDAGENASGFLDSNPTVEIKQGETVMSSALTRRLEATAKARGLNLTLDTFLIHKTLDARGEYKLRTLVGMRLSK